MILHLFPRFLEIDRNVFIAEKRYITQNVEQIVGPIDHNFHVAKQKPLLFIQQAERHFVIHFIM